MFPFPRLLPLLPVLLLLLAGRVSASLGFLDELRLAGDLDGDGSNELVLLLREDPGGSGTFVYLGVIRAGEDGTPQALFALVGDRVQVMDARIEEGVVVLEVIQPGGDEAACCGSRKVLRRWTLEAGQLVEAPLEVKGRVSVEDLEGRRWVLESFGGEKAPVEPAVTLEVENGRFVGSSGCNHYFAEVKDVEEPGRAIRVGPVGSTRKACPKPVMQEEQRYLEALRHVNAFGMEGHQLFLSWESDGRQGVLRFRQQPAAE